MPPNNPQQNPTILYGSIDDLPILPDDTIQLGTWYVTDDALPRVARAFYCVLVGVVQTWMEPANTAIGGVIPVAFGCGSTSGGVAPEYLPVWNDLIPAAANENQFVRFARSGILINMRAVASNAPDTALNLKYRIEQVDSLLVATMAGGQTQADSGLVAVAPYTAGQRISCSATQPLQGNTGAINLVITAELVVAPPT